jgi:hypothetical protein
MSTILGFKVDIGAAIMAAVFFVIFLALAISFYFLMHYLEIKTRKHEKRARSLGKRTRSEMQNDYERLNKR